MTVMDPLISIEVSFTQGELRRHHRVVSDAADLEAGVHEAIAFMHRHYGDGNDPADDGVWVPKIVAERLR